MDATDPRNDRAQDPRNNAPSAAFRAARIWPLAEPGRAPLTSHVVLTSGGRIEGVVPESEVQDLDAALGRGRDFGDVDLVPGFVDVQVNGGGGALFNDDPSVVGIRTIVEAHRRFGTTSMMPTFITDSGERMALARAAIETCLSSAEPGVLGVHFEGPFLDERKTGAHDKGFVREATAEDLAIVAGDYQGVTVLTLAANKMTAAVAGTLRAANVRVALGHCASTFEEATAALAQGATGITHLYNAMSPLGSRAPGLVGAALASDSVSCGLILDGVHVAYGAAKAALQALGRDRLMLVTDAVQPVGTDMTEFALGGQTVRLEGAQCINEEGNLAGSALDMATAVRHGVVHLGLPLEEAVWMATRSPAQFLGLGDEVGSLRPGRRADMTLLNATQHAIGTVVGGVVHLD